MIMSMKRSSWLYTGAVIAILLSHFVVDTYSSIIAPLIGVVQTEFDMRPATAAILLGMGSIFSGLAQPLFAWISDRTGSRAFGPLGIFLAAVGVCLVGYSTGPEMLFLIYALGMTGVGMFHPIATARIGSIAGDQRGFALSLFFVFGMIGFFCGSLFGPYLTTELGTLKSLAWLIIPGLAMAIALQLLINNSPAGAPKKTNKPLHELASYDWWSIFVLYCSAVLRFLVNMAVIYLIVRWVEFHVTIQNPELDAKEASKLAAPTAGYSHAAMFVGQGVGGLLAGAFIRLGQEKMPMVLTPVVFAPAVVLLGFVEPGWIGYVACCLGGIAFAAMTPITISVGQQLMPSHTRLASGLMLGGAWTIAAAGPRMGESLIHHVGLPTAFAVMGALLCLAGIVVVGMKPPVRKI